MGWRAGEGEPGEKGRARAMRGPGMTFCQGHCSCVRGCGKVAVSSILALGVAVSSGAISNESLLFGERARAVVFQPRSTDPAVRFILSQQFEGLYISERTARFLEIAALAGILQTILRNPFDT